MARTSLRRIGVASNTYATRLIAGAGTAVALSLFAASPALAGTLTKNGGELVYTAEAGHEDDLNYKLENTKLHLYISFRPPNESSLPLGPLPAGCILDPDGFGQDVICDVPSSIKVDLGDLEDSWEQDSSQAFDAPPLNVPMTVAGGAGADYIIGSIANDVLDGGLNDGPSFNTQHVEGDAGNDVITDASTSGATLVGGAGADSITSPANQASVDGGDVFFQPGDLNDTITVTGFGADVDGGDGNDTIAVSGVDTSGDGEENSVDGDAGDDNITGSAGPDNLYGGPGNDTIDAGAGDDYLGGDFLDGAGNDTLNGGDGNDQVYGDGGNDAVNGDAGDDKIGGGPGSDNVSAGDGNDELAGDNGTTNDAPGGNDVLNAGAGDDTLEPLTISSLFPDMAGSDTYVGGPGKDNFDYFWESGPVNITLNGVADDGHAGEGDNVGADIEVLGGSRGSDTLIGDDGPQEINGYEGDDDIEGRGGNDVLSGDDLEDTIDGGPGDDAIAGGTLADIMIGGPGQDSIVADGVCSTYGIDKCFAGINDVIDVFDGERDTVFCHSPYGAQEAADTVIGDPLDDIPTGNTFGGCKDVQIKQVQPETIGRKLTIAYNSKQDVFTGKLKSSSATCKSKVKVKVFRKKKGKDPLVGSDKTDKGGSYSVKEPRANGKFYAKVGAKPTPNGTCVPKTSKTISV
jgi:Ca2+-binding RTX toxin-like protein